MREELTDRDGRVLAAYDPETDTFELFGAEVVGKVGEVSFDLNSVGQGRVTFQGVNISVRSLYVLVQAGVMPLVQVTLPLCRE